MQWSSYAYDTNGDPEYVTAREYLAKLRANREKSLGQFEWNNSAINVLPFLLGAVACAYGLTRYVSVLLAVLIAIAAFGLGAFIFSIFKLSRGTLFVLPDGLAGVICLGIFSRLGFYYPYQRMSEMDVAKGVHIELQGQGRKLTLVERFGSDTRERFLGLLGHAATKVPGSLVIHS